MLADALIETQYLKGEIVIKEGDEGDAFFLLNKGVIQFSKNGQKISEMDSVKGGQFFGKRWKFI